MLYCMHLKKTHYTVLYTVALYLFLMLQYSPDYSINRSTTLNESQQFASISSSDDGCPQLFPICLHFYLDTRNLKTLRTISGP